MRRPVIAVLGYCLALAIWCVGTQAVVAENAGGFCEAAAKQKK